MITSSTILQLAGGAQGAGGSQMMFWVMIIAIFVIMYLFMIRPQKKRQKQIEQFRNSLKVGDDVITSGGIHGKIHEIDDANNIIVMEISKSVTIRIEKSSIFASNEQKKSLGQ